MSFLKFWGRKDKNGDGRDKRSGTPPVDPELEKRRLQHSLSISRSGRFKQRKRERGQILDKPELFDGQTPNHAESSSSSSADSTKPTSQSNVTESFVQSNARNSSPRSHCREVNHSMAARNMRIGQSVVT